MINAAEARKITDGSVIYSNLLKMVEEAIYKAANMGCSGCTISGSRVDTFPDDLTSRLISELTSLGYDVSVEVVGDDVTIVISW